VRRTYKYRAYPTAAQGEALHGQVNEACRLYNAALDERRSAWRMNGVSLGYYEQANQLKEIRSAGDVGVANFSACQDVLRRVNKTFAAFFRRVKAGEKQPGYRVSVRVSATTRSPGRVGVTAALSVRQAACTCKVWAISSSSGTVRCPPMRRSKP
jgi:transposase